MANTDQITRLLTGITTWREWRRQNPHVTPDFQGANLRRKDLRGTQLALANLAQANLAEVVLSDANLVRANLEEANLLWADLRYANLTEANLSSANLFEARLVRANLHRANLNRANLTMSDLFKADLSGASLYKANAVSANLTQANLSQANLHRACLSGADLLHADLSGADLTYAELLHANLSGANLSNAQLAHAYLADANLTGAHVFGLSAWEAELQDTDQRDLVITPTGAVRVTVDGLRNAQLVQLLLDHPSLKTLAQQAEARTALVAGHFPQKRKAALDAICDALRRRECVPVVLHLDPGAMKSSADMLRSLSGLVSFVLMDLSGPASLAELAVAVSTFGMPVQLLARKSHGEPDSDTSPGSPETPHVAFYRNPDQLRDDLTTVLLPQLDGFAPLTTNGVAP